MAALLLQTNAATANGRYAQATQLVLEPNASGKLWLMTTFGLLRTADGGGSWHWICEDALGMAASETFDPALAITRNGNLLIGLLHGLRTSSDGCSYRQEASFDGSLVADFSVDKREPSRALALVSFGVIPDGGSAPTYRNEVWETTDDGKSFTLVSTNLPSSAFITTLDSAPSEPNRIYLAAHTLQSGPTRRVVPSLLRSSDRGKNWEHAPLPLGAGVAAYIGAVHPTNPDALYVRTREQTPGGDVTSRLLYSDDAGNSWLEILTGVAPMLGFALAPDGASVVAGFGDPGDGVNTLEPSAFGIWRSAAPNFHFEKIFDQSNTCLAFSPAGDIFACSRAADAGFDLGLLRRASDSFTSLLDKRNVAGPLACGAGTNVSLGCTREAYRSLCSAIGCQPGGADGGLADGGFKSVDPPESDGRCGCSSVGKPASTAPGELAVLVLAGWSAARRRRFTNRSCVRSASRPSP